MRNVGPGKETGLVGEDSGAWGLMTFQDPGHRMVVASSSSLSTTNSETAWSCVRVI